MLLTDGETTVGRPTEAGAQEAADAGIPVFTIAFGTDGGSITDPASGEVVPVPVQPAPLEQVAEVTGGAAYEAATSAELTDAYERIQDSLGDTLGEEIQVVTELTWRWAAARAGPPGRRLGPLHVVAPRHGLSRASVRMSVAGATDIRTQTDQRQSRRPRRVSMVLTASAPTGLTDRWVTPASL